MKVCTKCHRELSDSEFGKSNGYNNKLKSQCKDCIRPARYKFNAKQRNLNYICLHDNIFLPDVKVHWHHINKDHVVALPAELHQACICSDRSKHLRLALKLYEKFYNNEEWEEIII